MVQAEGVASTLKRNTESTGRVIGFSINKGHELWDSYVLRGGMFGRVRVEHATRGEAKNDINVNGTEVHSTI